MAIGPPRKPKLGHMKDNILVLKFPEQLRALEGFWHCQGFGTVRLVLY